VAGQVEASLRVIGLQGKFKGTRYITVRAEKSHYAAVVICKPIEAKCL
jgi:hypothetical protein